MTYPGIHDFRGKLKFTPIHVQEWRPNLEPTPNSNPNPNPNLNPNPNNHPKPDSNSNPNFKIVEFKVDSSLSEESPQKNWGFMPLNFS